MDEDASTPRRLRRWLGAAASARGRGHAANGLPCQDASRVVVENGMVMIITSDGAGSARHSDEGAEIAVRCATEFLVACAPWQDVDGLASQLLRASRAALASRAEELGTTVDQLAATLSFVAVDGELCIVGNLGDGLVAGYSAGEATVLTSQSKGEFANETVFLTSSAAERCFEVMAVPAAEFDGFVVMTDGSAESLYQRATGTLAPAMERMLSWLDTNAPSVVEQALHDSALPMLLGRTMDDCSIALLRRVEVEVQQLIERPTTFQQQLLDVGNPVGLRNRLAVLRLAVEGASPDAIVAATGLSARTIKRHERATSHLLSED